MGEMKGSHRSTMVHHVLLLVAYSESLSQNHLDYQIAGTSEVVGSKNKTLPLFLKHCNSNTIGY